MKDSAGNRIRKILIENSEWMRENLPGLDYKRSKESAMNELDVEFLRPEQDADGWSRGEPERVVELVTESGLVRYFIDGSYIGLGRVTL